MFKTVVILLGIAYAVKQLIVPIITTNRKNKKHQVEFDLLKAQVKEEFEFLSSDRYQRTFWNEDRNFLHIEYLDLRQQRKIRIELSEVYRAFDIKVVDKGYYPVSIQTIFNDLKSPIDMRLVSGHGLKKLSKKASVLSEASRNNLQLIENYKSFRNEAYYTKILFNIRDELVSSKNTKLFNWDDSVYRSQLTKRYCEYCLREHDIKYAEIALILNAISPVVEDRDLIPQLTLIYFTINKINQEPKQTFEIYGNKDYNKHRKIFLRYLKVDEGTITAKSTGYDLKLTPVIEFVSKYHRNLDSFEKWYMHNRVDGSAPK